MTSVRTVSVTVAKNRSLIVPVIAGHRRDGEELMPVFSNRVAGPGEVVEVDENEVALLVGNGYVLDPNTAPPPMVVQDGRGPTDGRLNGMGAG